MKYLLSLLIIGVSAIGFSSAIEEKAWSDWKKAYNKVYENTTHDSLKFVIWRSHAASITRHNIRFMQGLETYKQRLNKFHDLTRKEFIQRHTGAKKRFNVLNSDSHSDRAGRLTTTTKRITTTGKNLKVNVDWRNVSGYVQPVKDQGNCGSCWAFTAVSTIEAQLFKQTGVQTSLSEQHLVDCVYGTNGGCNGGWMDDAFQYVKNNGGIESADSYPYTSTSYNNGLAGKCRFNTLGSSSIAAKIKGFTKILGTESALQNAVATVGPVSVAIYVTDNFVAYTSGIFYDSTCNNLTPNDINHAVTVVGYGTNSNGQDYWIVRNSWSANWGSNGYILMARNKNNNCFVASWPSYPYV